MDTDTATTIAIGQIINYVIPYLIAGLGVFWTYVLLPYVKKLLGTWVTNDQWNNVDREARTAAEQIWAEAKPTIAHEQITGVDPRIAFAVQECLVILKGTAENLGITPEYLQDALTKKIQAHLGHMQSVAGAQPVVVPAGTIPFIPPYIEHKLPETH